MPKLIVNGETRERPLELLRRLPSLYEVADGERVSLTQLLEDADPSSDWKDEDRALGAFGRVVAASGFRFVSEPSERIWADTYDDIQRTKEGRALIPEWGRHVWEKARTVGWKPQYRYHATKQYNRILESTESMLGSPLRPYVEAAGAYQLELEPPFSLDEILAFEQTIDGDTWRRVYMTKPAAADVRMLRIGETADIPLSRIVTSDHTNRVHKYGRGIEISYEAQRRVPIDKVGYFIAQAALQVEADRIAQAIDVALNGDGNANTAAENFDTSDLDAAATTAVTVKAWLGFKSQFTAPYGLTHLFGRKADLLNLRLLQMPNDYPFLADLGDFGNLQLLQDRYGGVVALAETDSVSAGTYLGIDARRALERTIEAGSDIEETKAYVERQTDALFFTQNDGYSILDEDAAKTLTIA